MSQSSKHFLKRWTLFIGCIGILYCVISALLFLKMTEVKHGLREFSLNTPKYFLKGPHNYPTFNYSAFASPDYTSVSFPSNPQSIHLSGWLVEYNKNNPTVILIHGKDESKANPNVLTSMKMLNQSHMNVLALDLRNHGESSITTGRTGLGSPEYKDAIAAKSWLKSQGFNANKIGVMGFSLGATTALISFYKDPEFSFLIADSPFTNIRSIIEKEMIDKKVPKLFLEGGLFIGKTFFNTDLLAENPMDHIPNLLDRPILLIHSKKDPLVPFTHALNLENALTFNPSFKTYFHNQPTHCKGMFDNATEYQDNLASFIKTL